jgi:hypothetical protein
VPNCLPERHSRIPRRPRIASNGSPPSNACQAAALPDNSNYPASAKIDVTSLRNLTCAREFAGKLNNVQKSGLNLTDNAR